MRPYAEGRGYSSIKRAGMILKREKMGMALVIEIKIFIQKKQAQERGHKEKSESKGGQFFNATMDRGDRFLIWVTKHIPLLPLSSPIKNEQSLRLQF